MWLISDVQGLISISSRALHVAHVSIVSSCLCRAQGTAYIYAVQGTAEYGHKGVLVLVFEVRRIMKFVKQNYITR